MTYARLRCLSSFAVLALAAVASAQNPPPAPSGFAWKPIESVKAAFLMPEGWHFKEESSANTTAFFISEENIDTSGAFQTGLTVNVIRLKKGEAQGQAAALLAELGRTPGNELQNTWQMEKGVLKGIGGRFRITEEGHPPILEYVLAIGNSRTNTLYRL